MKTNINTRAATLAAVAAATLIFDPKARLFDLGRVPRGLQNEVADPKSILAELQTTFTNFKAENDKLLDQVKKNGTESTTTRENVEKLNTRLTELQTKLDATQKQGDTIEAIVNRMNLGGGGVDKTAEEVDRMNLVLASNADGGTVHKIDAAGLKELKKAQNAYWRKGEKGIGGEMLNVLSVAADGEGYFVTPDTSGRIVKRLDELSPMRDIASVQTISTDKLTGVYDNETASAGWVAELESRDAETDVGDELGGWEIPVHEMYAMPAATQKLLDDASIDVEAWIAERVSRKFARTENAAFLNGDGVKKPKGIFSYPKLQQPTNGDDVAWGSFGFVKSGAAGAFAATNPGDAIIDLTYALKAGYRGNAQFLMARLTVAEVRKFKDTTGQYLWQPSLQAGQPSTLLGYGVTEFEDIAKIAANAFPIAFGDIKETYQIVDRQGIRVLRDPYTTKGRVKFYTTKRVGGGAINFESLKLLKIAA